MFEGWFEDDDQAKRFRDEDVASINSLLKTLDEAQTNYNNKEEPNDNKDDDDNNREDDAEFGPPQDDSDYDDEEEEEQGRTIYGNHLDFKYAKFQGEPLTKPIWQRPAAPPIKQEKAFVFQHTETNYAVVDNIPEVRIYGCTKDGNSVLIRTREFQPYFYAEIATTEEAEDIRDRLEEMFCNTRRKEQQNKRRNVKKDVTGYGGFRVKEYEYVVGMEVVHKHSICGWHRNKPPRPMIKFTMALPNMVRQAKDALEKANKDVTRRVITTYEANVPFELRYMVDTKLAGCQWIELPAGSYKPVTGSTRISSAQYEFAFEYQKIKPLDVNTHGDLGPMRYLSFDIETKRERKGFCNADEDPCVLICAALHQVGTGIIHKVAFLFVPPGKSVDPLENVTTYVYHSEEDMLLAFRQYIVECDPDAFTGWNITGFDWPYLAKRATVLGIFDQFAKFTRVEKQKAYLRAQTFESKAHGARQSNDLVCEGRFDYDGLLFMLRGQMTKYRSYKLNAISKEVLNDQKVDVDYTQIPILHNGSDTDRARLVHYCMKDVLLPLQLFEVLMAVVNGIEQARVTGVTIKWILSRGQGVKTFSNLLRYKKPFEVVPSRSPKHNNVFTAGGLVRKPIAGHYKWPLGTLDYTSLYPSIMQAYNICYSTVESLAWARQNLRPPTDADGGDYWIPESPDGGITQPDFCFVKKHIREGVLPELLTTLLNQRVMVKNMMKKVNKETNRTYYDVLEGRQLALKVVCNSVYGFLKAFTLTDPRLMAAVTSYGRMMILKSASIVEQMYKHNMIVDREACERLGIDYEREPTIIINEDGSEIVVDPRPRKEYAARIIYGDTDSIVIDFGDVGIQDVARYSREAAAACTREMEYPNTLAFESVKIHSLFLCPKKYGSLEIVGGDIKPGMKLADCIKKAKLSYKGLESKRRDNAPLGSETQQVVLEYVLLKDDIDGAVAHVKQVIEDILMDRIDMSKYIITKGLSKTEAHYKESGVKQPHTMLKDKIAKRAHRTGELVPVTGDRVPFVMHAGLAKDKTSDLSEDPIYLLKMGVPLDTKYYIKKQVMASTIRIFTCIWEPEKLPFVNGDTKKAVLVDLRVYNSIFRPGLPHTMKYKERQNHGYGIGAYTKKRATCLHPGCGVPIGPHDVSNVVCDEHKRGEAQANVMAIAAERVAKKAAAWSRCRTCAGGLFEEVTCANVTCDNYFYRQRVVQDVSDIEDVLTRFDEPEKAAPLERRERRVIDRVTEAGGEAAWRASLPQAKKKRCAPRKKKFITKASQLPSKR